MTSFKLKQVGLVLCLMASLLFGSASACTCSHHEDTKATEADCHSHHDSAANVEVAESGNAIDDICICAVNQRSPYVASRFANSELKSNDPVANSEQIIPDLESVAVTSSDATTYVYTRDLTYSNTLKSLLPSRAPPRL